MPFKAVIATELTPEGLAKGRGEVEVVGTHFNIMAYKNEPVIQTTLLKGSVKVVGEKLSKVLKPGQQATIIDYPVAADQLTVKGIPNAENLVTWKNGFFPSWEPNRCNDASDSHAWYDVDLEFEEKVRKSGSGGNYPAQLESKMYLRYWMQTAFTQCSTKPKEENNL